MSDAVASAPGTVWRDDARAADRRAGVEFDGVTSLIAGAVALGLLYAVGASMTFWIVDNPALGTAFFPSAGLTLGVLLISPRRAWPLMLAAVAIAEFTVDLSHHQRFAMAVGFAVANAVEPYVGATLMRPRRRTGRPTFQGFARFVGYGAIAG